jgi:hypothetical protein
LLKTGKQVPISLIQQIKKDNQELIREDVFNKTNINEYGNGNGNDNISSIPINNHQYHQYHQRGLSRQTNNATNRSTIPPPPPPHLYSQEYANYAGAQPRAMPSARIRLGGVF